MSKTRSRVPLERDRAGNRILTHGLRGYAWGCGCDVCTAAHTADMQERRAAASEAAGRGPLADEDIQNVSVPVRLNNQENPVTFRLSTREAAVLDRFTANRSAFVRDLLLAESGIEDAAGLSACARALRKTRSKFIRDTLLEALGIKDTAKRRKPRRPKGRAARNTTARDILLSALEAGQDSKQQGKGQQQ